MVDKATEAKTLADKHKEVFEVIFDPQDFPSIVMSSSLLITALGITVYEAAYCKTPVVVIGNYKTDKETGRAFHKSGCCEYLGYYEDVTDRKIMNAVKRMYAKKVTVKAPDKKGVERMARKIYG